MNARKQIKSKKEMLVPRYPPPRKEKGEGKLILRTSFVSGQQNLLHMTDLNSFKCVLEPLSFPSYSILIREFEKNSICRIPMPVSKNKKRGKKSEEWLYRLKIRIHLAVLLRCLWAVTA
ncbi:hypothetical protein TNIN_302081 [Trichonephila inaurata madagascariensis]|uniref:Uncharacterized protein n=1 Tax=Trichonephila inaurata madagascariensis TaxID=2747483 RepID=A0A8X7CK09_9ARAC|nr:hypothetical protein TNIN_302081 [Trichonephila inaurata madagascariensis]